MQAVTTRALTINALAVRDALHAAPEQLPKLSFLDGAEQAEPPAYGYQRQSFTLTVGSAALFGTARPSVTANTLLAAAISGLIGADPTLGGLAESIVYESSDLVYPEPTGIAVGVTVQFRVTYRTLFGNPNLQ